MLQDEPVYDIGAVEENLAKRAEELFGQGFNCCESIIKSSIETLKLPLPENTYLMGTFFREGVASSGCICGALAGGIMILGFIAGKDKKNIDLAKDFRAKFVKQFGSTCCRVLRKEQSFADRLTRKKCREITRFAAEILNQGLVEWKEV